MTTPEAPIHFAALQTLNQWLGVEKPIHEAITTGAKERQLKAIAKGANYFAIARNFRKCYDVDKQLQRFELVFNALEGVSPYEFEGDTVEQIYRFRDQLSASYGGHNLLSASTKFLWLKLRLPILIYDERARSALGTPYGDLAAFYKKWHSEFQGARELVEAACLELVNALHYCQYPQIGTATYVAALASQSWFAHRVFDRHLWLPREPTNLH